MKSSVHTAAVSLAPTLPKLLTLDLNQCTPGRSHTALKQRSCKGLLSREESQKNAAPCWQDGCGSLGRTHTFASTGKRWHSTGPGLCVRRWNRELLFTAAPWPLTALPWLCKFKGLPKEEQTTLPYYEHHLPSSPLFYSFCGKKLKCFSGIGWRFLYPLLIKTGS